MSYENFQKRRLMSSYFSVVFSVFLVLFLLGLLSFLSFNSTKLSNKIKENIVMSVYFKENATDSVLKSFGAELKNNSLIKFDSLIPKSVAAERHKKAIGEDFMKFIGLNPLQDSYDIYFDGKAVNNNQLRDFEVTFKKNTYVNDVVYDKNLINIVNKNIKNITFYLLIITFVLGIISALLINSSMRLSIYAQRFTIKTMQMVGATKSFIRKPFIYKSIKLGLVSASLAIIALLSIFYYIDVAFPKFNIFQDYLYIGFVLLEVLFLGIFIPWISTFIATQNYLNLKTDFLY
jgi:cell division transport system permease protein